MPDAADIRTAQEHVEAHGTRRFLVHEATIRDFRRVESVDYHKATLRRPAFSIATEQVSEQQTEQVAHLLAAMGKTPLSAREIMAKLGLAHRPTFRKNYLHPALEKGLVEMTLDPTRESLFLPLKANRGTGLCASHGAPLMVSYGSRDRLGAVVQRLDALSYYPQVGHWVRPD
jgi:hypothetical protein